MQDRNPHRGEIPSGCGARLRRWAVLNGRHVSTVDADAESAVSLRERQIVDRGSDANAGQGGETCERRLDEAPLLIAGREPKVGQRRVSVDDPASVKPRLDGEKTVETSQQQTGPDEQHRR